MSTETNRCKNCQFWQHRPDKDRNIGGFFILGKIGKPPINPQRYGECRHEHVWNVEGDGFIIGDNIGKMRELAEKHKKYVRFRQLLNSVSNLCAAEYGCIHFKLKK